MSVSLMKKVNKLYNETMALADPRADDYPFTDSPLINTLHVIFYLLIVVYVGPRLMKNRKAYNMREIIVTYNFLMVAFSSYTFYELLAGGWANGYSLVCQECDFSRSPQALRMQRACFLFWMSKHIEFFDTYFFVLKKKTNQITFLHVFHHSYMAYIWWWGFKFTPGGLGTFHAPINSLVHVIMYIYYGISAMGPSYRKYLWWKKYLTALQMVQFCTTTAHLLNILLFNDCNYATAFVYILLASGIVFFILFADFWVKTYLKQRQQQVDSQLCKRSGKPEEQEIYSKKHN
ncbi:very long chain fatty acid elongase 7-like [Clavelina lepadiformis]|uniref:very long chain fatty acid elongase 7-like n=1 Tax=Clavelina lepadiformis TaxID=159417 RepID=UPI0040411D3E